LGKEYTHRVKADLRPIVKFNTVREEIRQYRTPKGQAW
jgi:hypothetical protein